MLVGRIQRHAGGFAGEGRRGAETRQAAARRRGKDVIALEVRMALFHFAIGDVQLVVRRAIGDAGRVGAGGVPGGLGGIDDLGERHRGGGQRGAGQRREGDLEDLPAVAVAAAVGQEKVHRRRVIGRVGTGREDHALRVGQGHLGRQIVLLDDAAADGHLVEGGAGGIDRVQVAVGRVVGQAARRDVAKRA